MVRVPLPQEPLRVGVTPDFSAQRVVGPQDFSGQQIERFGQGLLRAGAATAELALRLQNDLDNARTKEADNRLADSEQRITSEFLSKLGKDASPEAMDAAVGSLQEMAERLGSGLDNDVQRSMFKDVSAARLRRTRDRIGRHSMAETHNWNVAETVARKENLIVEASNAWLTDPDGPEYELSVTRAIRETEAQAELQGLSPDSAQRKALVRDTTTGIHSGVIRELVQEGRGTEARRYLESVPRQEMDPDVRFQLQGIVRRASVAEEGAQLAVQVRDQIFADHRVRLRDPKRREPLGPTPSASSTLAQGLERLQAMFEAEEISLEVRDSAMSELKGLGQVMQTAEVDAKVRTMERAERFLLDNPLATVESLPADLYLDVVGFGLRDDLNAFAESGRRYVTDPEYFAGLLTPEGRAKMATMDARAFFAEARGKLNDGDLRRALAVYADVHDRATDEDFGIIKDLNRLELFGQQLGIDKKDDPDRWMLLVREVERRGRALASQGIKVGPSELDGILSSIAEEAVTLLPKAGVGTALFGVTAGTSFRRLPQLPVSLMTDAERARAAVLTEDQQIVRLAEVPGPRPDTPATLQPLSVREYLIGRLRLRNRPVTEASIVQAWLDAGKPGAVDPSWPSYKEINEAFTRSR